MAVHTNHERHMDDIEQRARELLAAQYDAMERHVAASFVRVGASEHTPAIKALASVLAVSDGMYGYVTAFHEVAEMLGIGARVHMPGTDEGSPKHVWETEMRPALLAILSVPTGAEERAVKLTQL